MTLKEATQFINYNIKEGVWSPEDFEGWGASQLVKFAIEQESRGDAYWEARLDEKN